jgi:hypothetical protein
MKALICVVVGLAMASARAEHESEYLPEDEVYSAPAVVYEAPVIYYAPVIYQAPVVYFAPVYYLTAPEVYYPEAPCPAPSTVFYLGNRGNSYALTQCSMSGSMVVHIGRGQAQAQGYQFSRPR